VSVFPPSAPFSGLKPNVLTVHTIGTAVELAMALILLRLFLLLRSSGEKVSGLAWIARVILLTTIIRTAHLILSWISISTTPPYWLETVAIALAFATTAAIPVILSAQYPPVQPMEKRKLSLARWLQGAMRVNAACGLIIFFIAWSQESKTLALLTSSFTWIVAAVLLCIKASSLENLQIRHRGLFLFSGFTIAALLEFSASFLFGYFSNVELRNSMTFAVSAEVYWMLMVLGMLFVFANLRLADVVVKRVVHMYVWCIVSLSLWVAIQTFSLSPLFPGNTYVATILPLLAVVLVGTVLAFTPASIRFIDGWIDHWVFQLPDFNGVIQQFGEELRKLENYEDVYRAGEKVISKTLAFPVVQIVSDKELRTIEESLPLISPEPHFLPATSALRTMFTPPVDVLVPLFREGLVDNWMVLGGGLLRPQLAATELSFVSRITGHIQNRIGAILVEQGKLERLQRENMLRSEIADAELRALRAQINPHFLFNSLNAIADLSAEAPAEAEEMTLRLSAVFRYVLINTDRPFTSIKEEIDFARSYLDIEEARFGSRLKVRFSVDPSILHERIPTLLLQPLIENALKHGLSPKREGGTLTISANRTPSGFRIVVSDNGIGLGAKPDGTQYQGANVGLQNVKKRLQTAYQGHATFALTTREGGGTEATVTIQKGQKDLA
jgi:two-component system, LytTR family, sensor kinase